MTESLMSLIGMRPWPRKAVVATGCLAVSAAILAAYGS